MKALLKRVLWVIKNHGWQVILFVPVYEYGSWTPKTADEVGCWTLLREWALWRVRMPVPWVGC